MPRIVSALPIEKEANRAIPEHRGPLGSELPRLEPVEADGAFETDEGVRTVQLDRPIDSGGSIRPRI